MRHPFFKILVLVAALAATFLPVPEAGAQDRSGLANLQQKLDEINTKISAVQALLAISANDEARNLLNRAINLLAEARSDYDRRRFESVRAKLTLASNLLDRAASIASANTLKRLKSRLENLLLRAESEVVGSGNREAERLLQQARRQRENARTAEVGGNFRRAVESYNFAISLSEKALNLTAHRRDVAATDVSPIAQEIARFQTLSARTREAIEQSQNKQAYDLYQLALREFSKAESAYRNGNHRLAEQVYYGSVRLLLRALDIASRSDRSAQGLLETELATVRELLLAARERAGGDPRVGPLLKRVADNLNLAEQALRKGRPRVVRTRLNVARRILEGLLRERDRQNQSPQSRAQTELGRLKADITAARIALADAAGEPVELLRLAERVGTRAEQDIEAGRPAAAMQRILVAQRLLTKAENWGRNRPQSLARTVAETKVQRLRQYLNEAESQVSGGSALAVQLLQDAQEVLAQAGTRLQQNQFVLAGELADVGMEIVKSTLRMSNQ